MSQSSSILPGGNSENEAALKVVYEGLFVANFCKFPNTFFSGYYNGASLKEKILRYVK